MSHRTETSSSPGGGLIHSDALSVLNSNGSSSVELLANINKDPGKARDGPGDNVLKLKSLYDGNNRSVEMLDEEIKTQTYNTGKRINGHESKTYSNDGFRSDVRGEEERDDDSQGMLCVKQAEECVNLLRSLSENCDEVPARDSAGFNFSAKPQKECLNAAVERENVLTSDLSKDEVEDSNESDVIVGMKGEQSTEDHLENIRSVVSCADDEVFSDEDNNGIDTREHSISDEQHVSGDVSPEINGVAKRVSKSDFPNSEMISTGSLADKTGGEVNVDVALTTNDYEAKLQVSNDSVALDKSKLVDIVHNYESKLDELKTVASLTDDAGDKRTEIQKSVNSGTYMDIDQAVPDVPLGVQNVDLSLSASTDEIDTEIPPPANPKAPSDEPELDTDVSQLVPDASRTVPDGVKGIPCVVENVPVIVAEDVLDSSKTISSVQQIVVPVISTQEHRKSTKPAKVKPPPDNMRPVGRILHDLGLDIVRQEVYKDLIDIQAAKDSDHRLSETEKGQLVKLTEAHLKLKMKNGPYNLARKRCASCRYSCTTSNVLQLHREFGNNKRDDVHICCICDFRTRFPSQFIVHMETVHSMTGRLAKRLSVIICPYCPFENKRGDKVDIHASKCVKRFNLHANLQPLPSDCDIAIRYKSTAWLQQAPTSNVPSSSELMRPQGGHGGAVGQSSNMMEIGGQLYSMGNHRGKPLLTSLRSQGGGSTAAPVVGSNPNFRNVLPMNRPAVPGGVQARIMSPYQVRPVQHKQTSNSAPLMTPLASMQQKLESCELCGTMTKSRQAFWAHMRGVHKIEVSQASLTEKDPCIPCEMCTARFWTYQGLATHSIHMHKRSIGAYDSSSTQGQSVFTGLRSVAPVASQGQGGAKSVFKCHLCGLSQPSLNPLNHLSTHHNITLLSMYQARQCYICNRKLRTGPGFEEHMVLQHRDIFANIEVLRTVLQALSSACFLKSDDRQVPSRSAGAAPVPRPAHTSYPAQYSNSPGVVPSQQYPYRGMMTNSPGAARLRGGVRASQQYAAPSRQVLTLPGGFNVRTSTSAVRYRSPMLGPGGTAAHGVHRKQKSAATTTAALPVVSPVMPPIKSPDKKTTEEEEKLLNKLYEDFADIGRPISRAMKQKLLTASTGGEMSGAGKEDGRAKEKRAANTSIDVSDEVPAKKLCLSPSVLDTDVGVKEDNAEVPPPPLLTVAPIV